jgi:mono/diheme cytochrome c family protein
MRQGFMRPKENYRPYLSVVLGLSLAILGTFQAYIWSEPVRLERDSAADRLAAEKSGQGLYTENCVACHGKSGEGGVGPAINERGLLESTADEAFFSLIRTGVPNTLMPAWGQTFGGPFTDEQVSQIVAFIRAWQPTAPVIEPRVEAADPVRGAGIYARTCFVCHGEDGMGTAIAPSLNNPERLKELDDAWYRSTITRPSGKGNATWGTVLSPMQINDVVHCWQPGEREDGSC